jgi:hypothetical protein
VNMYAEEFSMTMALSADAILASTFSTIGGGTKTLNLAGYDLSATSILLGANGIISSSVAGARIIDTGALTVSANGKLDCTNIAWVNVGGNWDSSAGTFLPGTKQVNMTSPYKSVKLGAAQTFYNLQLVNNVNITGQSRVTHLIKYVGLDIIGQYDWMNSTIIDSYRTNSSGVIDIQGRILYVADLYRMVLLYHVVPPLMITFPETEVIIGYSYSYLYAADQVVTWVVTSSADWLTVAGNPIGGIVDVLDIGSYTVNITGSNINGTVYQNYTVVVSAVEVIDLGIVYYMIFLISMLVLNLVGYFKGIGILQIITMLAVIGTAVAAFSAFSGYEMIAVMFVLIVVVMTAIGIMKRG